MADGMKSEPLTPELEKTLQEKMDEYHKASREISEMMEQLRIEHDDAADKFWNSLSYEDKCNAFHAVVQRLVQGELDVKGSYRYVLYDVFGFNEGMYIRGMDCGFMRLHNAIPTPDDEKL